MTFEGQFFTGTRGIYGFHEFKSIGEHTMSVTNKVLFKVHVCHIYDMIRGSYHLLIQLKHKFKPCNAMQCP